MHAEPHVSQLGGASSFATTFGNEQTAATAIAIVLDAEATSYLMMGSLSPGMKRHSVTLFEGGVLRSYPADSAGLSILYMGCILRCRIFKGESISHKMVALRLEDATLISPLYSEEG
jgi:hypothetical protein